VLNGRFHTYSTANTIYCQLDFILYVVPRTDRLVVPSHRASASISYNNERLVFEREVRFHMSAVSQSGTATADELLLHAPGKVTLRATTRRDVLTAPTEPPHATFSFMPTEASHAVTDAVTLPCPLQLPGGGEAWVLESPYPDW
jgi:hypothetical protein